MKSTLALFVLLAMVFGLSGMLRMFARGLYRKAAADDISDRKRLAILLCRDILIVLVVAGFVYGLSWLLPLVTANRAG